MILVKVSRRSRCSYLTSFERSRCVRRSGIVVYVVFIIYIMQDSFCLRASFCPTILLHFFYALGWVLLPVAWVPNNIHLLLHGTDNRAMGVTCEFLTKDCFVFFVEFARYIIDGAMVLYSAIINKKILNKNNINNSSAGEQHTPAARDLLKTISTT